MLFLDSSGSRSGKRGKQVPTTNYPISGPWSKSVLSDSARSNIVGAAEHEGEFYLQAACFQFSNIALFTRLASFNFPHISLSIRERSSSFPTFHSSPT